MPKREPLSSYEDYCRVWAGVYKKHARHAGRHIFSCYVRHGISKALEDGPSYQRPNREVTTDEDLVGVYIVRALVAQGMGESSIKAYTARMQNYVDEAEQLDLDAMYCMRDGLRKLGVDIDSAGVRIERLGNRLRYLWALHGGFDLVDADS